MVYITTVIHCNSFAFAVASSSETCNSSWHVWLWAIVIKVMNYYSYSTKILWLKLSPTNNNPKVILRFYLNAVGELEGKRVTAFYIIFIQWQRLTSFSRLSQHSEVWSWDRELFVSCHSYSHAWEFHRSVPIWKFNYQYCKPWHTHNMYISE